MFKKTLLGSLIAIGSLGVAQAQVKGTVNFKVSIPEILVLYHWDQAHLDLKAAAGAFVFGEDGGTKKHKKEADIGRTATTPYNINTDVVTTTLPTGYNTGDKITVNLVNSWAVRAITSKTLKLELATRKGGVLTRVGGSETIQIGDQKLTATQGSGTGTNPIQFANIGWTDTSLAKGSIQFSLNLTGATKAGDYITAGSKFAGNRSVAERENDTFLLTLTAQ